MDISQAKKLSPDKIEADFLTKIVRRNIKRKELEKQKAREAFREAFEVLLESQDASTKTQSLMLDELQRLNARTEQAEQAEQDQQPQGRYADRFPRGRDGRIILYGDSEDGGDDRRGVDDGGDSGDDDDDQFFDARNYVDQPRRPRRRRPAIIDQQELDDIRDQQENLRQQQQLQDLRQQLLNQRRAQQQEEEELYNQQVEQQKQQERLNQLRQRLIQPQAQPQPQPQAQPQPQTQQDAITALQQQLAQERERTVALQNQNRESQRLNKEMQREQQAQREILTEPASSVVGDLASAVGDLSSASALALGKLASSGVSNLVVKPLKGAADIIKSSFTPSTPVVRSSDVFPESQSVRSSDVFPSTQLVTPNQTGIWSSTNPSFSTPYPMEYQTGLTSQAAAIRSAQQAAQLMSVPRVQSSSPPSSLPSSSLTLQPETTTPSSSYQQYTPLPFSSLEYPSQPLSGQPLSSSYILPPPPPPPGSTLTFTSQLSSSQLPSKDYDDFQELQNLFLPPLQDLDQYDTRYLTQLSPQLDQQVQSVTGRINGMKRKKNPTPEYQNEIRRFSKYKEDLKKYRNAFRDKLNYRYQTGTGIWNTNPQELLNRLELLGGSLATGNNGVLPEYFQIAHRLRDLGVISNKQLNKMLRKYINIK